MDFEYAQRYDDKATHPARIVRGRRSATHVASDEMQGTENYMAVEVDYQCYVFPSMEPTRAEQKQMHISPPVKSVLELLMDDDEDDVDEQASDSSNESETPPIIFAHNPLHDLESLHWVGIDMVANRYIISVDSGKKRPHTDIHPGLDKQHEWARGLFYDLKERHKMMIVPHYFFEFIKTLDPRVQPLGHFLQMISKALRARYRLAEEDVDSIDYNIARGLYILFKPTMLNNIDLDNFKGYRIARIDNATLEEERIKRRKLKQS